MTILYIQNDPHGLILSAIAISTVFFCLLVLWGRLLAGRLHIHQREGQFPRRHRPRIATDAAKPFAGKRNCCGDSHSTRAAHREKPFRSMHHIRDTGP